MKNFLQTIFHYIQIPFHLHHQTSANHCDNLIFRTRAIGASEEEALQRYLAKLRKRSLNVESCSDCIFVIFPQTLRVFNIAFKEKKPGFSHGKPHRRVQCYTRYDLSRTWHSDLFSHGTMGLNLSMSLLFSNENRVNCNEDTILKFSNGDLLSLHLYDEEKKMLDEGSITRQMELILQHSVCSKGSPSTSGWIISADPSQLRKAGFKCIPKSKPKELKHFRSASFLEEILGENDKNFLDSASLFPSKGSASLMPHCEKNTMIEEEASWVILQYFDFQGQMLNQVKVEFPEGHRTVQIQDTSSQDRVLFRCIVFRGGTIFRSRLCKVFKAREFKQLFSLAPSRLPLATTSRKSKKDGVDFVEQVSNVESRRSPLMGLGGEGGWME